MIEDIDTVNVDGDIVAYSCGFAAEDVRYQTPDGEIFSRKGDAKTHCVNTEQDPNELTRIVEAEPLAHALHSVKKLLLRVKDRTGAKRVKVWLSGKVNFREYVATIRPYKGQRDNIKPYHYEAIIKYIINNRDWDCEITDGYEADDALGFSQTEHSCIATIDKDLDMIPGFHYNWRADKLYDVTEESAIRSFYTQMLTGDTIDNIPGVPGIGPKRAEGLLRGCYEEDDMYGQVLCQYSLKYERPMEALIENGRLLWIMRKRGELWTPPW